MPARHGQVSSVIFALASLVAATVCASEDEFLLAFLEGDYVVIGRDADDGMPYTGRARIEQHEGRLLLSRNVNGEMVTSVGEIEIPGPPGESRVLRFHDDADSERTSSCLIHGDLDNHARLTCYWTIDGSEHTEPGLEAYFPTATWPEEAPNKSFKHPANGELM